MMSDNVEKIEEIVIVEETPDGEVLLELVIVEEYVKHGKPVPKGKLYRIRIDKKEYETPKHELKGREILGLAGKTPEEWNLYQIFRGRQPVPVQPDEEIDLHKHCIERFTTVPKDPGEGLAPAPRRDFVLSASDQEFLDSLGLRWETWASPNNQRWLVIFEWSIPAGYNVSTAAVALNLPNDYPDTQIDMAFFKPALSRTDGKGINNLGQTTVGQETDWQQWSRHRTAAHPWRPSEDDISSHLALVDDWLRREFKR